MTYNGLTSEYGDQLKKVDDAFGRVADDKDKDNGHQYCSYDDVPVIKI
jgi:hypothetical protein